MKFILSFLFLFSLNAFALPDVGVSQIAPINLTSAGTAQVLSATATAYDGVLINALAANTGVIYVGDSAVSSTNGFPLAKGDTLVLCGQNGKRVNLNKIYIDGGTTNDDVKVTVVSGACPALVPKPL